MYHVDFRSKWRAEEIRLLKLILKHWASFKVFSMSCLNFQMSLLRSLVLVHDQGCMWPSVVQGHAWNGRRFSLWCFNLQNEMADPFQLSAQTTSELLNIGKSETVVPLKYLFDIETMQVGSWYFCLVFWGYFWGRRVCLFVFSRTKGCKTRGLLNG